MSDPPRRVREQVVVYLAPGDRELLERMVEETGLSRTELFREGLRRMASTRQAETSLGSGFEALVEGASDEPVPRDLSERADHYLYGGGHARRASGGDGS